MDKEDVFKKALGLKPNEYYLCFSRMGGVGIIKCENSGHKEKIVSFTHGITSGSIERQCPQCHAFVVEDNKSQKYYRFEDTTVDFVCPKCGSVIRKKEVPILKGNDSPLFCPKCHIPRLHYQLCYLS